jgi:RNA polymerase sigma factor (TIGR02999 family)
MRRVLVDAARARRAEKRGGDLIRVTFDDGLLPTNRAADLLALEDGLVSLAAFDARKGRVVELRYFGGLSLEETAEALGVSTKTVMRDWEFAKAWLQRGITRHRSSDAG